MRRLARACLGLLAVLGGQSVAQPAPRIPLFGYVDRSGNVVEPAVYSAGSTVFRGDWVAVHKGGKAGYLNLRTKASTGIVFDDVKEDLERVLFADAPEPVQLGGKWGFVDPTGKLVIPAKFDGASSFGADGLAVVDVIPAAGVPRRQGLIDKAGAFVVLPKYEAVGHYVADLASFSVDGRWGKIDRQGREVIPPRFKSLGAFAGNGLAPASLNGEFSDPATLYGYVDRSGRFAIAESYKWAGSFDPTPFDGGMEAPEGLARVVLSSGETAYIDSGGKVVTRFPARMYAYGISPNGLVRFQDTITAKYGFADRSGAIVIPARFGQVGAFDRNGLASATLGGKAGYIRADGSWAFEPRFSFVSAFDEHGQAQADENGKAVLIDGSGRTVATLPDGTSFFWQRSDYASFRAIPPRIDYPVEQFGGWRLERTLYAAPEHDTMEPAPIGSIRLAFRTSDGLVRWAIETEGWVIDVTTRQGPEKNWDASSRTRLDKLPTRAKALTRILAEHLTERAGTRIAMSPPGGGDRAAQRARLQRSAASRSAYLAELKASAPDLERALRAMDARIREQFGTLSGPPCMPPRCVY